MKKNNLDSKKTNKKILIVEDDRDISDLMSLIIENEGYTTKKLYNANDIFLNITKYSPDLIIMDLHIENIDGAGLVKKLKHTKETKSIPVVLVSAKNSLDEIAENAGAEGYLSKPFDIQDLINSISNLL